MTTDIAHEGPTGKEYSSTASKETQFHTPSSSENDGSDKPADVNKEDLKPHDPADSAAEIEYPST